MSMKDLSISTSFILNCCVSAQYARRIVKNAIKKDVGLVLVLIYEAIAAAELSACCLELGVVHENFGVAYYAVYLFLLCIWWSEVWGDISPGPHMHVADLLEGKTTLADVALRTWAELMGGFCVYRIVQLFWWFEFAGTHVGRAFEACDGDLQVNLYVGVFIEVFANLLSLLTSRTLSERNVKFASVIDSFISICLVVPALERTGGYFNPFLSTVLTWGCSGHTKLEHIIVYWIGDFTGAALAAYLLKLSTIRKILFGSELAKNKTKEE